MIINVYQSGGFSGDQIKLKELDTTNLAPNEQDIISKLVNQANFFQLNQQEVAGRTMGSDLLEYEIDILDKSDTGSVKFVKASHTPELNQLLEFVLSKQ